MYIENQRAVYEYVNILDNQVYEWVHFFKGQVYESGMWLAHPYHSYPQVTPSPHWYIES